MSRVNWAASLFLTALLSPSVALGQEREVTEDALVEYLEQAIPKRDEAVRTMREDRARREREALLDNLAQTDTIQVGLLTVVARSDQVDLARSIYSSAMERYSFVDRSPTLESVVFTFQWATDRKGILIEDHEAIRAEFRGFVTRSDIEAAVRDRIARQLQRDLEEVPRGPDGLQVSGPIAPSGFREWVYRNVAMMGLEHAGSCLDSDAMACWDLLGMGRPWHEWSTAEERLALLLQGHMGSPRSTAERAAWQACRQDDAAECDNALRYAEERGVFTTPLLDDGESSISLLWVALSEGGEGAWGRLLDNQHRPAEEALVAASGVGPERLAARFREHLLEGRPSLQSDGRIPGLFAILWILAFAGLATRSTRWRFG